MQPRFQPMPLARKREPFNHSDWLFELKYDGFRALARIERGKAQLISRNGHPFASFSDLAESMADSLPSGDDIVLDGEIVCLDRKGRPQFNDLLFRRGKPCFFAFDLLYSDGKDWRRDSLVERKAALRALLHRLPADSRLRYADHIEGSGIALFQSVCKLDLEGIVAKYKFALTGEKIHSAPGTRSAIGAIHRWSDEICCSSATDTKNQFLAGTRANSLAQRPLKPLQSCLKWCFPQCDVAEFEQ